MDGLGRLQAARLLGWGRHRQYYSSPNELILMDTQTELILLGTPTELILQDTPTELILLGT